MRTDHDGEPRIDRLSRALAATPNRRGVLRGLAGALGLALAGRAGPAAAVDCEKVGRPCERNADCCEGERCRDGVCECRPGYAECNRRCYVLATDALHCGACGNACGAGETCCGGACVGLDGDADHCGGCGERCPGICTTGPDGSRQCTGPRCCGDGVCVDDVASNPDHCGACNHACGAGKACCGGACVALETDEENCGACGRVCAAGRTCCGGACVDLQQSEANCSYCGRVCASGEACCGGRCVDLDTDEDNCGACANACYSRYGQGSGPEACCGGECVPYNDNCGVCGVTCFGEVCCEGVCCPPGAVCGPELKNTATGWIPTGRYICLFPE